MNTELCEKCGRPLWEKLCAYCRGYKQGVSDAKDRKIKEELIYSTNESK